MEYFVTARLDVRSVKNSCVFLAEFARDGGEPVLLNAYDFDERKMAKKYPTEKEALRDAEALVGESVRAAHVHCLLDDKRTTKWRQTVKNHR